MVQTQRLLGTRLPLVGRVRIAGEPGGSSEQTKSLAWRAITQERRTGPSPALAGDQSTQLRPKAQFKPTLPIPEKGGG